MVLRGEATIVLQNKRYQLSRSAMIFFKPDEPHLLLDASMDFQTYVLTIAHKRLGSADEHLQNLLKKQKNIKAKHLDEKTLLDLADWFDKTIEIFNRTEDSDKINSKIKKLQYQLCLYHSVSSFIQAKAWNSHTQFHPNVAQALYYLNDLENKELIQIHCQKMGMSYSHLSRVFSKQMGMSMNKYRNKVRITYAEKLMQQSNHQLTEIAYLAGFGSYTQFHNVFIRTFGLAPKKYRKNILN